MGNPQLRNPRIIQRISWILQLRQKTIRKVEPFLKNCYKTPKGVFSCPIIHTWQQTTLFKSQTTLMTQLHSSAMSTPIIATRKISQKSLLMNKTLENSHSVKSCGLSTSSMSGTQFRIGRRRTSILNDF